ncbi:MAG: ABC-F family ATP-binding cassette domain-containing protein [Candidatus Latescibacterota bacterium]|jgi:ATP-binding cassette subfamily F protein 3
MSLVRLHDVTLRFDDNVVLHHVFFRLSAGERVGLIGRNGSGKTSLLRLILGRQEPSEGMVEAERTARIGYFSQFSELGGQRSIVEELEALFPHVQALEQELGQVEEALAQSPEAARLDALLQRQAALLEEMQRLDGWGYRNRIDTVLSRLGFSAEHRLLPVERLSGGWRNRAALARILVEDPDVLLLDEPTNYLDIEGLAWLESWLLKVRGALILVSHDRLFLDRVVTRIVEMENHQLQEYQGGFTQYVQEKPTRLKSLQNQFQHEEELLAYEAEAIADRREAQRDPDPLLRRRLANIRKRQEPRLVDRIITGLYQGLRVRDSLCKVEMLSKAYGERILFLDLGFELRRGHRLTVVGPNACGKTTLLRLLALQEAPDTGRVAWQSGTEFCLFNQVLADLDPEDTVTHAVNVVPLANKAPRRQVHRFLELMQFSEMDLTQRLGALSGGQRARVALAICLLSGASVVLLDEPTNHLDVTSTQVMERALVHFPGAVVAVSHDRFFLDKVSNRLLVFEEEGVVRLVEGGWSLYQAGGR